MAFVIAGTAAAQDDLPKITITADQSPFAVGVDTLTFTVTREGSTDDAVDVPVTFSQTQNWLSIVVLEDTVVTIASGSSSGDVSFDNRDFHLGVTANGTLTATVGDVNGYNTADATATVQMISQAGPAIQVSMTQRTYTFAEDTSGNKAVIVARAATGIERVGINIVVSLRTEEDTATGAEDYDTLVTFNTIKPANWGLEGGRLVARKERTLRLRHDDVYEGTEGFDLNLESTPGFPSEVALTLPDGTDCGSQCDNEDAYRVSITDEADLPVLALSGDVTVAEGASVDTTVRITNGKTFAGDRTFYFTLGGNATVTDDYNVSTSDEDDMEEGWQVTLPELMSSVDLSLTTVDDQLTEADETIEVNAAVDFEEGFHDDGEMDEPNLTRVGSGRTITIEDDDDLTATISGPTTVAEGSSATYTLTLSGGTSTADVLVAYSVTGTATSGTDYTAPSEKTLTIEAGTASGTFEIAAENDGVLDPGETMIVTLTGVSTTKGSGNVSSTAKSVTTTITDSSMVTVSVAAAEAAEGNALSFAVTLSGKVASDVVLGWSTTAGTAVSGTDYTAVDSGNLTIEAGDTSGTLTVLTTEDNLTEADETLSVTISGTTLPTGVSLATGNTTATGTIVDDDDLTAAISGPATVAEGSSATYTVTLTGGTSTADVVVAYSVTGTATSGTDYTTASEKTLTIESGTASGTFGIAAENDGVLDPGETIIVTLTEVSTAKGSAEVSSTAKSVTTTITDSSMVTVSVAAAEAAEGNALSFAVTLSGKVASDVVLGWSTTAGTAVSGTDYTAVDSGNLTIEAGDTSGTLSVTTKEDALTEADETLTVTITGTTLPIGVSLATGGTIATGTIEDDDPLTVSVAANPLSVTEGQSATFPVTLTGGTSTADVVVTYTVTGTAISGTDYTAPSRTLTIPSAASSGTISIATLTDQVLEPGETLVVTLDDATTTGSVEVSDTAGSATAAITDPGMVTASIGPTSAEEGNSLTFTVTLSGSVASNVVLGWSTSAGTAVSDTDYSAASGTLTFEANDTSETLTVSTAEDTLTEEDETLTVTITGTTLPSGVSLGVAKATGRIEDDDDLTAGVAAPATVPEGATVEFTVTLTGGTSTANVVVDYSVGGTATSGEDYTKPTGTLTISSGGSSGAISIDTKADDVLDRGETLRVTLDAVTTEKGAAEVSGTSGSAETTITDSGMVTASVADASAVEGEALAFAVTLTGKVSEDVLLDWSTTAGTAVSDTDYGAVGSERLAIKAGETSGTLTVSTNEDALTEANETLTVTLAGATLPDGVSLGDSTATGTLHDDDPLTVAVSANPLSVTEGDEAVFPVSLTGGTSTADVVVTYTVDGTATRNLDYTAPSGSLTVGSGEASGAITIATLADQVLEPGETLIVTLEAATTTGTAEVSETAGSATAAITDPGMVTVSVAPAAASEGDVAEFPVTLSGEVASDVVLTGNTRAGTAEAGTDYTTMTAEIVTIAAGDTTGILRVTTAEDTLTEDAETFEVTISSTALPSGVSMGVAAATATIRDDDELTASVTTTTPTVAEGQPARFGVTLSGGTSTADVVVSYSLGGSATEGRDYEVPARSLTVPAGAGSGTIEIATKEDDLLEPNETLILTLVDVFTAKGRANVDATPATATITSVSAGPGAGSDQILLSASPSTVAEDGGAQTIEVTATLGGELRTTAATVTVTVTGGTATRHVDFEGVEPFDVTIPAEAPSGRANFTLAPVADSARESKETVLLSGVADAPDLLVTAAEVTILDSSPDPDPVPDPDPGLPIVSIAAATGVVVEGATVEFTVSRSSTSEDLPPVPVTISETGSMLGEGLPVAIRFVAGETTALLRLETLDDEVREPDSEVRATLTAGAGYELGTPLSAAVTVADDDTMPREVVLTLDPEEVSEGDGPTVVSVTAALSGGLRKAATVVGVRVAGSGRGSAVGFRPVDPFEITIPAGASTGSARFTLTPENDSLDERDETIDVSGNSILPVTPASLVLKDDDEESTSIALAVAPEVVPENGGSVMVEVTASLDLSARSVDTAVSIALSGSGEPGAVDYRAVDSFEVTIPMGALTGTASFSVTPEDDRVDEFHETIRLSGRSALPVTPAALMLEDDDEPSEAIQLTVAPQVVLEDAGPTLVTVMASLDRSARLEETDVWIEVTGSDRTGVVGFEPVETFELTIPPEEVSGFGTFLLTPVNDMVEARTESVEVLGEADMPVTSTQVSLLDDDDASHARAWLSRFARTVASQTVETVEERLLGSSGVGNHLTLAGQQVFAGRRPHGRGTGLPTTAFGRGARFAGWRLPAGSSTAGPPAGWYPRGRRLSFSRYRGNQRWDLLARTSFSLSSEVEDADDEDGAGALNWTAWGRGALTNFRGIENDLSLRGDVVTGTVGVDVEQGRILSGFAVGFSQGEGGFQGGPNAQASLTTGHPYLRVRVNEDLDVWGVLGYGRGGFSLTEEDGRTKETDIEFAMGAVGLRRDLASSKRGFGLGLLSDVLLARIESDPVPGLAAVGEEVERVRLAVEGSYERPLAGGGTLLPTLELGVRHDGGDADAGVGVEMGAGLRYMNAERGLRIEFAGRSLLTHQASDFEEWGGSGAVTLDPGESGRGLALGLRASWGATHGGVRQFWSRQQTFDSMRGSGLVQREQVEAEAGYGLGRSGGRSLVSPYGVLMLGGEGERGFAAGTRYDFARDLSLSLELSRRQFAGAEPEDAVVLHGVLRRGRRRNGSRRTRTLGAASSRRRHRLGPGPAPELSTNSRPFPTPPTAMASPSGQTTWNEASAAAPSRSSSWRIRGRSGFSGRPMASVVPLARRRTFASCRSPSAGQYDSDVRMTRWT